MYEYEVLNPKRKVQGCKNTTLMLGGRKSGLVILDHNPNKQASVYVLYAKRSLQSCMPDPYTVRGILLARFMPTCPLRGEGRSKSAQSSSD